MKAAIVAALLLAVTGAHAQDAPASAPADSFGAYRAAEDCMREYGRRFGPTNAAPQDVADAALASCFRKRYAAAAESAQRRRLPATAANTDTDETGLRRLAIQACLEARYPRAR